MTEEKILRIPELCNKQNVYEINKIYTPRGFKNSNEYVTHLENLRKLKSYPTIVEHLYKLENNVYRKIVQTKLEKLNWKEKIKVNINNEKKKLNIEKKKKEIKLEKITENNIKLDKTSEYKKKSILDIKQTCKKNKYPMRAQSSLDNIKNYDDEIMKINKQEYSRFPKIV